MVVIYDDDDDICIQSGWDANERDPDGKTAIFMAAERDLPHICLALIAKGAAVNAYCK